MADLVALHPRPPAVTPALLAEDVARAESTFAAEGRMLADTQHMYGLARDAVDRARGDKYRSIALLNWLRSLGALQRQHDRAIHAEVHYRRLVHEQAQEPLWQARTQELRDTLLAEYGDRGPQYALLVQRLVAAEVRAEQLEQSTRDRDVREWRDCVREVTSTIQALQRYTEAEKTEVLQGAQHAAMVVALRLVEEILATKAPALWLEVTQHVKARVEQGALEGGAA